MKLHVNLTVVLSVVGCTNSNKQTSSHCAKTHSLVSAVLFRKSSLQFDMFTYRVKGSREHGST